MQNIEYMQIIKKHPIQLHTQFMVHVQRCMLEQPRSVIVNIKHAYCPINFWLETFKKIFLPSVHLRITQGCGYIF